MLGSCYLLYPHLKPPPKSLCGPIFGIPSGSGANKLFSGTKSEDLWVGGGGAGWEGQIIWCQCWWFSLFFVPCFRMLQEVSRKPKSELCLLRTELVVVPSVWTVLAYRDKTFPQTNRLNCKLELLGSFHAQTLSKPILGEPVVLSGAVEIDLRWRQRCSNNPVALRFSGCRKLSLL